MGGAAPSTEILIFMFLGQIAGAYMAVRWFYRPKQFWLSNLLLLLAQIVLGIVVGGAFALGLSLSVLSIWV
jgi:hypothetical protein